MNTVPLNKFVKRLDDQASWTAQEIKGVLFDLTVDGAAFGPAESAPRTRKPKGYAEPIDFSKGSAGTETIEG